MNYTWKIESVDDGAKTMIVKYTLNGADTVLNIPKPSLSDDVAAHVQRFAPIQTWRLTQQDHFEIAVGTEGTGTFEVEPPAPAPAPEPANVVGSVNEEYLRALIFQVLEEINAPPAE